ncbi:MAG: rhodanese-like domain-containing protein [Butyribacter sp.]|nr:rhodanese-like domain-containing protein [bacterium]MDY3855041.1 rhodanese-like domain-containing protein [Butyribacter sp.]
MQFKIISCEILEQYLTRNDILLLDLRNREDYDREHIPHAIWADWETLEEQMPQLLSQLDFSPAWIILYCSHGNTSLLIARDLARNGYPVISLNGGYAYWQKHLLSHSSPMQFP